MKIILKHSSTSASVPTPQDLEVGEVAINTADAKAYTKHTDGTIRVLSENNPLSSLTQSLTAVTFGLELLPQTDNALNIGAAAQRVSTVYAASGVISTSDATLKCDVADIPDEWLQAWSTVQFVRYKFKDAVATKGDSARWHFGVLAQRVKEAFESRGIDPFSIGLLCVDTVVDGQGNTQERFGIRYDEALVLECAYMRKQLERLSTPKKRSSPKKSTPSTGDTDGTPTKHTTATPPRKPRRKTGDGG